jgi:ParB-like nuclease domain
MRKPATPSFARFGAPAPASGGGLREKESNMTQATTIDPISGLATPEVDISQIRVTEGYNPRKLKDPETLQALADSIADLGIVEPLIVSPPDEDGFFDLKVGERRLGAATRRWREEGPDHRDLRRQRR